MPHRIGIEERAPYRDPAAAAQARLAALGEEARCAECANVRARTTATVRDVRAVAGSFGIILGLLLVELLLVSFAHGAFGRFENPALLVKVLVVGSIACGSLCWVAWGSRAPRSGPGEDEHVLATLSRGPSVRCSKPHTLDIATYLRSFRSERRVRGSCP